jgi:hypothetical protein
MFREYVNHAKTHDKLLGARSVQSTDFEESDSGRGKERERDRKGVGGEERE